jgi:hypothetical protein
MSILRKIIFIHDRLLTAEVSRRRNRTAIDLLLFAAGLAAVAVGWMTEEEISKLLLITGGFALGLFAEKFAQMQYRRVEKSRNQHSNEGSI